MRKWTRIGKAEEKAELSKKLEREQQKFQEELKKRDEEHQKKMKMLRDENTKKVEDVDKFSFIQTQEIEKLEKDVKTMTEAKRSLEDRNRELEKLEESSRVQLATAVKTNEYLTAKNGELAAKVTERDGEIFQLKEQIKHLESSAAVTKPGKEAVRIPRKLAYAVNELREISDSRTVQARQLGVENVRLQQQARLVTDFIKKKENEFAELRAVMFQGPSTSGLDVTPLPAPAAKSAQPTEVPSTSSMPPPLMPPRSEEKMSQLDMEMRHRFVSIIPADLKDIEMCDWGSPNLIELW